MEKTAMFFSSALNFKFKLDSLWETRSFSVSWHTQGASYCLTLRLCLLENCETTIFLTTGKKILVTEKAMKHGLNLLQKFFVKKGKMPLENASPHFS